MTAITGMKPLAILLLAAPCLAGTTDDGVADSRYVDYGKGFAPYTKRLTVVEKGGRITFSTAVVIDAHHALTAAHVVQDYVAGSVAGNPVEGVSIHDDYSTDGFWFDIAIVRCRDDFALAYYPRLSDGDEREGATVSIAGFGVHGPLSTGYGQSDGLLRAGTNTIERFDKTLIICTARRGSSPMELCISPGDSGGPLFVGSGPAARLAGINACTMSEPGRPLRSAEGEESGHTRVAYFREWIDGVVGCGK